MIYVSVGIACGPANIFKYIYPEAVTWVKNKLFPTDHHRVISTGNLRYSIITSGMLVTIILIDVSILFFYLCKFRHDAATFMVVLLSYIVSLVLICVCIGYKNNYPSGNGRILLFDYPYMFPIIVYYIFHVCIIRYHYSGIYGWNVVDICGNDFLCRCCHVSHLCESDI